MAAKTMPGATSSAIAWTLVVLAGCATVPPPVAPVAPAPVATPVCPVVAAPWIHEHLPRSDLHCVGPLWPVNHQATPYEEDIEVAVHYICKLYAGPDGLPLVPMLGGALGELTRIYPALQLSFTRDGQFLLAAGDHATEVGPAPREPVKLFVMQLARAADFARRMLPADAIAAHGSPEHVLLQGALSALAWRSWFAASPGESLDPPRVAEETYPERANLMFMDARQIAHLLVYAHSPGMTAEFRRFFARQPARGVVLDLRESSGGLLDEATRLVDLFTRKGCIATMRPGAPRPLAATDDEDDIDAPIVILVGPKTAEGAELVAASLRARGRAILVGGRSEGKGIVTAVYSLPSRARIRVATAELLDGNGQPFVGVGLTPDVIVRESADEDRGNPLAIEILTHSQGNRRADLLAAAAKLPTPQ